MIGPSLTEYLDRLTPVQCYLIARHLNSRGRRIPTWEIAVLSGLSKQKVVWISRQKSWRSISVGDAEAFMRGCGVTLSNRFRHLLYLKRTSNSGWPLAHLANLPSKTRQSLLKSL